MKLPILLNSNLNHRLQRPLVLICMVMLFLAPAAFAQDEVVLFRVNAGGNLVDDWEADSEISPSSYLLAGSANIETIKGSATLDATVPAGTPLSLFETKRIDANQPEPFMKWTFSVPSIDEVEVRLYFIEMSRCSAGNRIFDISIGTNISIEDFDVYAEAGNQCKTGIMRSYIATPDADVLTIEFPLKNGKPSVVAGIEILEIASGNIDPSTLSVSPTFIDFANFPNNTTSPPITVTLTNDGTNSISIDEISLVGGSPTQFLLDAPLPSMVPGESSVDVEVRYSPNNLIFPPPPPFTNVESLYRVNVGGQFVFDVDDNWREDTETNSSPYLDAGSTTIESITAIPTLDASVPAGTPVELFMANRIDADEAAPNMSWNFPVLEPFSDYEVRLYFVEQSQCAADSRLFDVKINDVVAINDLDIYSAAGGCNIGIMRSYSFYWTGSDFEVEFIHENGALPSVAAIEVIGPNPLPSVHLTAQLSIEHTGSNPALIVDLEAEAEDTINFNNAPSAGFILSANSLSVDFTDTSTDSDGTITGWSWDFGDGNASTDQNPSHTYASAGIYTVSLTATDNDGAFNSTSSEVTVSEGDGTGAYIESEGLVVMETENAHEIIARNGHWWEEKTDLIGYSGVSYMEALPDVNVRYKKNEVDQAPELQLLVDFTTMGSYSVWARVSGPAYKSGTIHMGIDGVPQEDESVIGGNFGTWGWGRLFKHSKVRPFEVTTPGIHTINVWMREDGVQVDKVILTTDFAYYPGGITSVGPPESPRHGSDVAGRASHRLDALLPLDAIEALPTEFALGSNYPNPFNPTTTINFELPEAASVSLIVYDMMGRQVATLVEGQMSAGRYEAQWDALTDAGTRVASGMYLYRLRAGSFEAVNRMVLMK